MVTTRTSTLGEQVRAVREAAGVTREAVAAAALISSATLKNLETGRAHSTRATVRAVFHGLAACGIDLAPFQEGSS